MRKNRSVWRSKFAKSTIRGVVAGLFFFVNCGPSLLLAQVTTVIIPDATLPGGNNSVVTPSGPRFDIGGGHAAGSNLFHSFSDFQVGGGDTANFFGQGASNILSRVTGSNPSNIFGTFGVDTHLPDAARSNANLFFLNPNGVVFGPTSSLDLKGSFHVSTADYIRLGTGENDRFSASPTDTDNLISATPMAFGFLSGNPKGINVNGSLPNGPFLGVPSAKTISFVAGPIGISNSTVQAGSGQINIVSVGTSGEVKIESGTINRISSLDVADFTTMGKIDLISSIIDVGSTPDGGRAGKVLIRGGELVVGGSLSPQPRNPGIYALNFRDFNGDAINPGIDIEMTNLFNLKDGNILRIDAGASSRAGDIKIQTGPTGIVKVLNATISNQVVNPSVDGKAGEIRMDTGSLELVNGGIVINGTLVPDGTPGKIDVIAKDHILITGSGNGGRSRVSTQSDNVGVGNTPETATIGAINISVENAAKTGRLEIKEGAGIRTGARGSATSGKITVDADEIELSGVGESTFSGITSITNIRDISPPFGKGGDIEINTHNLRILGGAGISVESQSASLGDAGSIIVNSNEVFVSGSGEIQLGLEAGEHPSSIKATTEFTGSGGLITLNVGALTLENQAEITSSSTFSGESAGPPGSIRIQGLGSPADLITLSNSTISTTVAGGTDSTSPGNISITATGLELHDGTGINPDSMGQAPAGNITLTNGAQITANTSGGAPAGDVVLTATESVALTEGSEASSASFGKGAAGRLNIVASLVTLERSSSLNTITTGPGNAGDIRVDGTTVTISSGSVLNSSTFGSGAAGRVTVKGTESVTIAGLDPTTNFKSAVASAAVAGTGAAGTVTIAAPAISIAEGGTVSTSNSFNNGKAGDITLDGHRVTISGGGQVTSSTSSEAPGGTVTVTATESVAIRGSDNQGSPSRIGTVTFFGGGEAGQVSITAPEFSMEGGEITASSLFSGGAGNIDINAEMASLTGGSQVVTNSIGNGGGGQITFTVTDALLVGGADAAGTFTTISSSTSGSSNAGEIRLVAPTMTMTDGAFVTAFSDGTGKAGAVTLQAERLTISGGALVDSSTFGTGQGGEVRITATEELQVTGRNDDGPSQISTITAGTGNAGQIEITTPVLVVEGGAIVANTGATGAAGNILVETGQLSLTQGALISSRGVQTAKGNAGSVNLQVDGLFSSEASTLSSEAKQGTGGNVSIRAGNMSLGRGTTISAKSEGTKNAGSITLTSSSNLRLQDTSITTFADQASGGNINFVSPNLIHLTESKVESSVQGDAQTQGGDVNLDPQFIVLHDSRISATATSGFGGNINLIGNVVLVDLFSTIDASSQFGISGSVNIQAPIQNLSGSIAPLPGAIVEAASLYSANCAGQKGGAFSSFTVQGRDRIPLEPGELLPTPLMLPDSTQELTPISRHSTLPMTTRLHLPILSGRPDAGLMRPIFDEGCHF